MFRKRNIIKYDYTEIHNRINEKILSFCQMLKNHPLYETNDMFRKFFTNVIWDGEKVVEHWTPEHSYSWNYTFGIPIYGDNLHKQIAWEEWEKNIDDIIEVYTKRIEEYVEWHKAPNDFDLREAKFVKFEANPLGITSDHYMYLFGARMCNEKNGWLFLGLDNSEGCQIDTTFVSRDEYKFLPMTASDFVVFLSQERIRLEKAGKLITEIDEEFNKLREEFEEQNKKLKDD